MLKIVKLMHRLEQVKTGLLKRKSTISPSGTSEPLQSFLQAFKLLLSKDCSCRAVTAEYCSEDLLPKTFINGAYRRPLLVDENWRWMT